jgi:predicted dehydrogenase
MSERVAIIGTTGIGRYHALWWFLEGAEVCAFVGTTEQSVADSAFALGELFSFAGRGYTQVEAMLEQERPSIVDVCSPAEFHFLHARAALESGASVFCEKPFVLGEDTGLKSSREQAMALGELAQSKGLRLAVCTQYAEAAPLLKGMLEAGGDAAPLTFFKGHLQAPFQERAPDPDRVWLDLAPHPLSVLTALCGNGEVDWDSLGVHFEGYTARALFTYHPQDRPPVECDIVTGNSRGDPSYIRFFQLNDRPFNVRLISNREGISEAEIETPGEVRREPDFLRLRIRNFLRGAMADTLDDSIHGLEIMLEILERSGELSV